MTLVFRALEGGRTGDVWVGGPGTRAKFKSVTGIARMVTLRFKPGWSVPLLGVAAASSRIGSCPWRTCGAAGARPLR